MIKTVTLSGNELKVDKLDGFNAVVHNLSGNTVYASKYPGIAPGADNVAEIPAGTAKLISTTNGLVYLLGTGKVELTGQDYEGVNFASTSPVIYADGGDVSKAYVDEQISKISDDITELKNTAVTVSNPNLLDNWYFADPINQKGKTEYTGSGYLFDRWAVFDYKQATMTLTEKSHITFTFPADTLTIIGQLIPNPWLYMGKTLTFSVLTADNKLYSSTTTLKSEDTTVDTNQVYINDCWINIFYSSNYKVLFARFVSDTSATVDIVAVKLELGDKQTLARQDSSGKWVLNDPPPNKALELEKCQRYYQVFATKSLRPTKAEDFRPPMRANPTLGTISVNGTTYYTADANL